MSSLLPIHPHRSTQQPQARDSARSKVRSVLQCFLKKSLAYYFLPRRLSFPCEGDVPMTVLVSRLLAWHDLSSDKSPRQLHDRMTASASHHQPLPCHQLPHQSFNGEWNVSLLWALQSPRRHFAGLRGHCALLKLGPTIFVVSPCLDGDLGLSRKTCP